MDLDDISRITENVGDSYFQYFQDHKYNVALKKKSQVWENFASNWKMDLSPLVKEVSLEQLENEISTILEGEQVGRVLVKVS